MEIYKMLTISASHIKRETWRMLQEDQIESVATYKKEYNGDLYGFFIVASDCEVDEVAEVAPDLAECIEFALLHDCAWLCIDEDGEVTPMLPSYKWYD